MIRGVTCALFALNAALAGTAPLQCAWRRPHELAREDSPGEALWMLAERFGASGDLAARRATLRFLIERYPGSRFAMRARDELANDAAAPPASGPATEPSGSSASR